MSPKMLTKSSLVGKEPLGPIWLRQKYKNMCLFAYSRLHNYNPPCEDPSDNRNPPPFVNVTLWGSRTCPKKCDQNPENILHPCSHQLKTCQKYMPVLCQEYMQFFCLPLSNQPRLDGIWPVGHACAVLCWGTRCRCRASAQHGTGMTNWPNTIQCLG